MGGFTSSFDYFQSVKLWSYWDNNVTTNNLNFECYFFSTEKSPTVCEPRFKFSIYSKSNTPSSISLEVSELYKYTYKLKKHILDKLPSLISKTKSDKKFTDGFVHNGPKTNIYTTIMYNANINDTCIRFMVGAKEETLLDTDKVYIPLIDILSLYGILNKAYENYVNMCSTVSVINIIKKKLTAIEEKIDKIPVDKERVEPVVLMETLQASDQVLSSLSTESEPESELGTLQISEQIMSCLMPENESESEEVESEEVSEEKNAVQQDFDAFLVEKRDTFALDMPGQEKVQEEPPKEQPAPKVKKPRNPNIKTVKEIEIEDVVSKDVLKNEFKNMEMIVTNCINTPVPLDTFTKTVLNTTGINLYEGFSDLDLYCLNYITTKNLKHNINRYIQQKVDFPKSISPIIVPDNKYNDADESYKNIRIQIMYFLLMSYIYLSKVKTQLSERTKSAQDNKEFLCYALKTMTTCYVFSYMLNINKNVLVGYVDKLYNKLRNDGFFNTFEEEIQKKTGVSVVVTSQVIKDDVERIYNTVNERKEKLVIPNFFNPKIMKMGYSDFQKIETPFNVNVVDKICKIDTLYINGKIDKIDDVLKNYDDVPLSVLSVYGVKKQKFDNSVLLSYFKKNVPDFPDMEQIKNINSNVYDVLDSLNIQNYGVKALRALYFWDVKKLPKNIKLSEFEKMVDDSGLETSMLISMILDRNYQSDDDFYNSLQVC